MATSIQNQQVIDEFRANSGKVGGNYEGRPLLLLTTTGRKTGTKHTTPVMYLAHQDGYCVFASKGGAPVHPSWYLNLVANPRVLVEVGTERFEAQAKVVDPHERDVLYEKQSSLFSQFADYQRNTTRKIPVVLLTRV